MARPVVALLTDFGLRDHYVGTMKGVVLSVCPDATIVDLTHDIPPQDVTAGAWQLAAAFQFFPPATVFLAVVDPGVGTARRALAAEAGGYYFVAPDNGLLSEVFHQSPPSLVVELLERKYARQQISRTFEGRDRFAPAAGWIARNTPLGHFGPAVTDWKTLPRSEVPVSDDVVVGAVMLVDRFGNLITNIAHHTVAAFADDAVVVQVGPHRIEGLSGTYGDVPHDTVCALMSSSGHLEIAINGGSAAERLALTCGAPVRVSRHT